jgi:trimeric autotransporter adhesin
MNYVILLHIYTHAFFYLMKGLVDFILNNATGLLRGKLISLFFLALFLLPSNRVSASFDINHYFATGHPHPCEIVVDSVFLDFGYQEEPTWLEILSANGMGQWSRDRGATWGSSIYIGLLPAGFNSIMLYYRFVAPATPLPTGYSSYDYIDIYLGSPEFASIYFRTGTSVGISTTNTGPICAGGTVNFSTNAAGAVSYLWSGPGGVLSTLASPSITGATPAASGVYSVTTTTSTGCSVTTTTNVIVSPNSGAISGGSVVCAGSSITQSSDSVGGSWSSGSPSVASVGSLSGIVTGIASGTSVISYLVSGGCPTLKTVTVNSIPDIGSISGSSVICAGSNTSMTTGLAGGDWSSGSPSVATVGSTGVVNGIATGTAVISYILANGCGADTATHVITVDPTPTVAAITGDASTCPGEGTLLANATPGGTWSSSNPSVATIGTGGGVSGLSPGTTIISYVVTNSCGTANATIELTVNSVCTLITGITGICPGGTTVLSHPDTGGVWTSGNSAIASVGSHSGIVTGTSAGNVYITYTSGGGSYSTIEVTVATPGAIVGSTNICVGLTATMSNPVSGGTWSSSDPAKATIGATTGVVTALAGGSVIITYDMGSACIQTKTIFLQHPLLTITGTPVTCEASSTTLYCLTGPGGAWTSSDPSVALANMSTGAVIGVSSGTAIITYSLVGCFATRQVTVNAAPAAITGIAAFCVGNTSTLSSTTTGGTWSSSNTSTAAIVGSTGVVTGIAVGTSSITYTSSLGCSVKKIVTVSSLPAPITGPVSLCNGSAVTLSSATAGGTWSSSATSVATTGTIAYNSTTVTGISTGSINISYTVGGCSQIATVSVTAAPGAISGATTLCVGSSATLVSSTTGGTWSSSSSAYANIGSSTGVLNATSAGITTITYRTSTSCYTTANVTVNSIPAAIAGSPIVCVGLTTALSHSVSGGTWSSSATGNAAIDAVTGVVTGVATGTATITYTIGSGCYRTVNISVYGAPAAIGGAAEACVGTATTLTNATHGGTWTSSDVAVAIVGNTTGAVSGISGGTATITYSLASTGCYATKDVTINTLPASISGGASVCLGATVTLTCATTGGTWSSSAISVAPIDAATGVLTGISGGGAYISYTLPTGCKTTQYMSVVNPPASISGTPLLCLGNTTMLTSATASQTWSSSNTSVASIASGTTGSVTGTGAGTAIISYTNASGCSRTIVVTVDAALAANTGGNSVCVGHTVALSNATTGGTWASSTTPKATVGYYTGIVSGIAAGTTNITYRVASGCVSITQVTVNAAPAAISGPNKVCVGQAITLTHSTPGGTWSTTSPTATVDASGAVTGMSAGYAYITYTPSPGCAVTTLILVKALPHAITGPASVAVGTYIALTDATSGGAWSSGGTSIASMPYSSLGYVLGVSAGSVDITYTIPSTGCFVTYPITVYSTSSRPANPGIESQPLAFALFPNPTSGSVGINADVDGDFTMYTLEGKLLLQYHLQTGHTNLSLPDGLAAGVYMCGFRGIDGSTKMIRLTVGK